MYAHICIDNMKINYRKLRNALIKIAKKITKDPNLIHDAASEAMAAILSAPKSKKFSFYFMLGKWRLIDYIRKELVYQKHFTTDFDWENVEKILIEQRYGRKTPKRRH